MEVELRFFATVREAVGKRTTRRAFDPGATVRDALADTETRVPELEGRLLADDGGVARGITVMRNGTNVTHYDGADTELADGDSLSITPPVTGG
ncbi:ubiquitin-like small modifier protein 1 [Natronomonas sp.]|uniref:ubiquitin-like small modifier protein 1 n=1 Tax=Natronomonas sp. TaxID=2184060 RepID=UPI002611727A|nr:ubiquitin-like small modifier protein 1 [Natronomonas sp.]